MSPIEFDCPQCGKKLRVRDELAGKKGKCPGCGNVVVVPTAPPGPPVQVGPPPPLAGPPPQPGPPPLPTDYKSGVAASSSRFVSLNTRSLVATALLVLFVTITLVAVVSDQAQISLLKRAIAEGGVSQAEADANDARQGTVAIAQILILIVAGVSFLVWFHRAHKNLPALGAAGLDYSPGWAVGGFFVPFLNLYRPFQVMREIWKASDPHTTDSGSWRTAPSSPLVSLWWAFFLISGAAGYLLVTLGGRDTSTVEGVLTMSRAALLSDILNIPDAVLAILLVRTITSRQEEKNGLLDSLTAPAPPPQVPQRMGT